MKNILLSLLILTLGSFIALGQAPTIQTVVPPTNKTYKIGEDLVFEVTYDVDVDVTEVTNKPRIAITLNTGGTVYADYLNGTGSAVLQFSYTVEEGNLDSDGIVIASSIDLNGETIKAKETPYTDAELTFTPLITNGILIDGVKPTVTNVSSTKPNGTYKIGDVIDVTVTFSEVVTVAADATQPTLLIKTGDATSRAAVYNTGSGSSTLTFKYTVGEGDESADLDYVDASSLVDGDGKITDAAGNIANKTLTYSGGGLLATNKAIVIDGVKPTVGTPSSTASAGPHKVGTVVNITVPFLEAVNVIGSPILWLSVGTNQRYATYQSGTGTSSLTFRYTVSSNDITTKLDYTDINSLQLNGGSIKDLAGNDATLTLAAPGSGILGSGSVDVAIDGVSPTVLNITSTNDPGTYILGQGPLVITVQFSESVTINTNAGVNKPTLQLETGRTDGVATYSGANTFTGTTLTFEYPIVAGHQTSKLDYKGTRSLLLNGASINDAAGNLSNLTLPQPGTTGSLGANKTIVVDAEVPLISLVSSSSSNGSYKNLDEIIITVAFTEPVIVAGGTPKLTLNANADPVSEAVYFAGSGTSTLLFKYTVGASDAATRLDYESGSSIVLGTSSIKDATGNNATLTLPAYTGDPLTGTLAQRKNIVIDNTPPAANTLTSTAAAKTYLLGETIDIVVDFVEPVFVSGKPRLKLNAGSDAYAVYLSGRGTRYLTFRYIVGVIHTAADLGLRLNGADPFPIDLNAGSIVDRAGNAASLLLVGKSISYSTLPTEDDRVVDGIVPSILNVFADTDDTYKEGNTVTLKVLFSTSVDVTGTPKLYLNSDRTAAYAEYRTVDGGSGTNTLLFDYVVGLNHSSAKLDYQRTRSLVLGVGGSIEKPSSNDADLTLPSPGTEGSLSGGGSTYAANTIVIDGIKPTVTRVSALNANGIYRQGAIIDITIAFSEVVNVDDASGKPTITLNTTPARTAEYLNGTGSNTLVFRYTVQADDAATRLDYVDGSSITLNSGVITDEAENTATLTLPLYTGIPAVGTLALRKNIVIDDAKPVITGISTIAGAATKKIGDQVEITVTFDESVTVIGKPRLKLNAGDNGYAIYRSGRGTNALKFLYTVAEGDNSGVNDVNFDGANALELFGGSTITDIAGNDPSSDIGGDYWVVVIPGAVVTTGLANRTGIKIDGIAPRVTNVTSTKDDGSYSTGVVAIQVVFDNEVTVNDNSGANKPRLYLNSARTGCYAEYASGSGNTTLVFNYTIASGHNSPDLDYIRTSSLDLNGGTIKKKTGGANNAILSLPNPGGDNSLGKNKNIIIDTQVPTVTSISSTSANRAYMVGEKIYISVVFSEVVVTSSAVSTLALNSGGTANLYSGTGNTLVYEYEVLTNHTAANLDYTAINSLVLSSGTIKDAAGNDAVLTLPNPGERNSLGRNKKIVIDGVKPTVSNVTSPNPNGNYVTGSDIYVRVVFSEVVMVTGRPTLTLETGATDRDAFYFSGSGTNQLTFKYSVQTGDLSTGLDYVDANSLKLNGGTIKDQAGNAATLTLANPSEAGSLGANKDIEINNSKKSTQTNDNSSNDNNLLSRLNFNLYPNPSNGNVNISIEGMEESGVAVEVYDAIGRVVYSELSVTTSQLQLNLSTPPGIYLMRLRAGEKVISKRFVIQ
jgi:hypothetical protein